VSYELQVLMAKDLGVKPDFVEIPYGTAQIEALMSGEVDILQNYTNTPQRALTMEFSERLFSMDVTILVKTDGPIKKKDDLNKKGIVIISPPGQCHTDQAYVEFPNATIWELREHEINLDDKWDAMIKAPTTKSYLKLHPEVRVLLDDDGNPLVLSREYGHMAIRSGDQRFLNWINNWIDFRRAQGDVQYWCETWWLPQVVHLPMHY
jgi:polar amino acid transport system substrate-binding protein